MRVSNEIKAGVVVLVAVATGVMFFAKTAAFKKETYEVKTFFGYAGDLKTDAIVKLSGVEVGRVKAMNFVYNPHTHIECFLELNADAKVRADSIAYIGTSGFVGDAYVGITAGESDNFADPGSIMQSEDPVQIRLLFKKAESIAASLDDILVATKDLVTENKENLNNIVTNIELTTENFKEFSQDLKAHPWKLMFKGE
ncbi:MAG: MCE family protein [Candidatus Omnitrophica bacterium]|nr:MCE family protein [Candidatus Omnitrophota bacterium]